MMSRESADRMVRMALIMRRFLLGKRWIRHDRIERYRLVSQSLIRFNQKCAAVGLVRDNVADKFQNDDRRIVFAHDLF